MLKAESLDSQINHYQAKLFPFAYNIVGDYFEAEDIVQESLNNFILGEQENITSSFNYLVKTVINKSINFKNSLRNRKEVYPGNWLPVPIFTEETIYSEADQSQILNYSLLVLLEKLKPHERAVFILKETYDFPHQEIGEILEITTEYSRQLLKRAKQKIAPYPAQPLHPKKENAEIMEQLAEAISNTDIEKVKSLLSASVQSISDGGPKASAARKILEGEDRVYKFLKALWHKYVPGSPKKFLSVNHSPAILFFHQSLVFRVMVFEMTGNKIDKIYIIVNPDKLQHFNAQNDISERH